MEYSFADSDNISANGQTRKENELNSTTFGDRNAAFPTSASTPTGGKLADSRAQTEAANRFLEESRRRTGVGLEENTATQNLVWGGLDGLVW
jgi:hypothetical protein